MNTQEIILPVFTNPNQDKSVKETTNLNAFSAHFRQDAFCKKYVSEEGFELNPMYFHWEYIIKFNNRSGFMVLTERGKDLMLYVYKTENDLDWSEFLIKDFNRFDNRTMSRMTQLVKSAYRLIK